MSACLCPWNFNRSKGRQILSHGFLKNIRIVTRFMDVCLSFSLFKGSLEYARLYENGTWVIFPVRTFQKDLKESKLLMYVYLPLCWGLPKYSKDRTLMGCLCSTVQNCQPIEKLQPRKHADLILFWGLQKTRNHTWKDTCLCSLVQSPQSL